MKKLFVTGISGFLGWHILSVEQSEWEIHGCFNQKSIDHQRCFAVDLSDKTAIQRALEKVQPDAILHMAALSNPNFCEQHPEQSFAINVEATKVLVSFAERQQIPFLFTSTDLVFDGKKGNYSEDDLPNPVNMYAQHKVQAEEVILKAYPKATIARLPLLYGLTGRPDNFMYHWINKLKAGEIVHAFSDEFRTPASGIDAAKGIFLLLDKKEQGIWHLGGQERISRFDFALEMARAFQLDENLIKASLQAEVKMPAPRPANVSLDSSKTVALGFQTQSLQENFISYKMNSRLT